MGNYATTTTLDTLAVGTTFDTATTAVASTCIDWAENRINNALSKLYDVSDLIATPPPQVISMSERMGLGFFYQQMSRGSKESLTRGKALIDMVEAELKSILEGNTDLVNTSGSLVPESNTNQLGVLDNTSTYTNTFAEDDPLNWAVDTDKLDDIKSNRD